MMRNILYGTLGLIVLVVLWQIYACSPPAQRVGLPGALSVANSMLAQITGRDFWWSLVQTLWHVAIITFIAALGGVVIGVFLARWPIAAAILAFPIDVVRSAPLVIIYVLFIPLIGLDPLAKSLLIGVYLSLHFCSFVLEQFLAMRERYDIVRRSLIISESRFDRLIVLPSSYPQIVGYLKNMISLSIVLAIVFEMFTANYAGLGSLVYELNEHGRYSDVAAIVVLTGVVAYLASQYLAQRPNAF